MTDDPLRAALERIAAMGWRQAASDAAIEAGAALAASATDEGRPYCTLECKHSLWEPHPARPAVPEALDVERLARAIRSPLALFFVTSDKGYVEMAERIAREYAALRSEEPTK